MCSSDLSHPAGRYPAASLRGRRGVRDARAERRNEHVSVEGAQGKNSAGSAPDSFLPSGASTGFRQFTVGSSQLAGAYVVPGSARTLVVSGCRADAVVSGFSRTVFGRQRPAKRKDKPPPKEDALLTRVVGNVRLPAMYTDAALDIGCDTNTLASRSTASRTVAVAIVTPWTD